MRRSGSGIDWVGSTRYRSSIGLTNAISLCLNRSIIRYRSNQDDLMRFLNTRNARLDNALRD